MKINKIRVNNLSKIDNTKQVGKKSNANNLSYAKSQNIPSSAYKQFALSFKATEDESKDKNTDKPLFDKEEIEAFAKRFATLSPKEQEEKLNNVINGFLSFIAAETVRKREEIVVPSGLSVREEELFKSVAHLVNIREDSIENPEKVTIFSNSFSTLAVEPDFCYMPSSAPIFKNDEFLELFQSLNVIENNDIGKIIKFAFQNDEQITQRKLFKKFTLGRQPIYETEHSAKYQRTLKRFVYAEEDMTGTNLTSITETYKASRFDNERLSVRYEFDGEGALAKIIKYDSSSTPSCVLILDNKNKKVTVQERNKDPRHINFENGEFTEQ